MGRSEQEARSILMVPLVQAVAKAKSTILGLEADASVIQVDRKLISKTLSDSRASEMTFVHVQPHEESLVQVSDAVAWCYSRGGDWQRRVQPLVGNRIFRVK